MGLIAQEVEQVFPDWVGCDQEGYKFVTDPVTGLVSAQFEPVEQRNPECANGRADPLIRSGVPIVSLHQAATLPVAADAMPRS